MFNDWIGISETISDEICPSMVRRIATTLNKPSPDEGSPLPYLWHWAFFQDPVYAQDIGVDGHPKMGKFLPALGRRNRMWAGGRVSFFCGLEVGEAAERISTILSVEEKKGRAGSLVFVTVEHVYKQNDRVCIREEQDIVYREPASPKLSSSVTIDALDWSEEIQTDSTMLFRYSAVTFNGHKIHYDFPYATEEEGYPGLVVHGPLISTLLLQSFTKRNDGKKIERFEYRGVRPLICGNRFMLGGSENGDNSCALWAFDENGPAQQAIVYYKED